MKRQTTFALKTKDQLLVFALGRDTHIYEAANKFLESTNKKGVLSPSRIGPWYTEKNKLLAQKFIIKVRTENRKNLIRANITKYVDSALADSTELKFREENTKIFEKYAPRIVDFLIKEHWFTEIGDPYYPLAFYLLMRYLVSIGNQMVTPEKARVIRSVNLFIQELSEQEKQELTVSDDDNQVKLLESMFKVLPLPLFKETVMEIGVRILNIAIFKKQQFDFLIDNLDIPNDVSYEQLAEYNKDLRELRKKHFDR